MPEQASPKTLPPLCSLPPLSLSLLAYVFKFYFIKQEATRCIAYNSHNELWKFQIIENDEYLLI